MKIVEDPGFAGCYSSIKTKNRTLTEATRNMNTDRHPQNRKATNAAQERISGIKPVYVAAVFAAVSILSYAAVVWIVLALCETAGIMSWVDLSSWAKAGFVFITVTIVGSFGLVLMLAATGED